MSITNLLDLQNVFTFPGIKASLPSYRSALNKLQAAADKLSALSENQRGLDDRFDESFASLSHPSMVSEKMLSMMIQNKLHNIQKIITSFGIDPATLFVNNSKAEIKQERVEMRNSNTNQERRWQKSTAAIERDIPMYFTSSYRKQNTSRCYTPSSQRTIPRYTSTQRAHIPSYRSSNRSQENIPNVRRFSPPATEEYFTSRYSLKRKYQDNHEVDTTKPFKFAKVIF